MSVNITNTLPKVPAGLCCLFLFSQSAQSQTAPPSCTPVLYAFRHAEDVNGPPTALTPIGTEHANLYIEMITSLEVTQNYCPVATVYAVSPKKPDGSDGTTNPYFTARPLGSYIPAVPKPPRNAAHIFQWVETSRPLTPWRPKSVPNYIECYQCKALITTGPSKSTAVPNFSSYKYYCGIEYNFENYSPDLGGNPSKLYPVGNKILREYLYELHGKICDLANLNLSEPITGYYGFCTSGSKSTAF
jgi:hypothetical protein